MSYSCEVPRACRSEFDGDKLGVLFGRLLRRVAVATIGVILGWPAVGFSQRSSVFVEETVTVARGGFVEGPRLASDGKGTVWLAWLSRLTDGHERILTRRYQGQWSEPTPLRSVPGEYEASCPARAPGGLPMIAWVNAADWTLQASTYANGPSARRCRADGGRPGRQPVARGWAGRSVLAGLGNLWQGEVPHSA